MFGDPTWTAALAQEHVAKGKVWLYHYEREQPFFEGQRFRDFDNVPNLGAFHGSELPYMFGSLHVLSRAWTAKDREISRDFQAYMVNFAKTGNPNGKGLANWPAFDDGKRNKVMHVGDRFYLGDVPGLSRLEFLDEAAHGGP